jgi:CreA protein
MTKIKLVAGVLAGIALVGTVAYSFLARDHGDEIGAVNTAFHMTGSDYISVDAYEDPDIDGVVCYLSRARTGKLSGLVGVSTDKTESAIACAKTGENVVVRHPLDRKTVLFSEKMSVAFKTLNVVRMVDPQRHQLLYLVYSDKLLDGSPKNNLSVVSLPPSVELPLR